MTAARLWSADGLTATLTGHPDGTGWFTVLVDGETASTRVDMDGWQFAPCCGYCDRPAEMQLKDGRPDDLLCTVCSRDHFDQPGQWVRPIPRRYIRQAFADAADRQRRHYEQQAARSRVPVRSRAHI